jgi:microcystin-dependent protein
MSCNNCFNGCVETISDQCIKYTGENIPSLGIDNGDSLAAVENAITTYLLTVMDGTGIFPDIDVDVLCIVSNYLPPSGPITLVDILTALVESACDLQGQIDDLHTDMDALNAEYTTDCLPNVDATSDTHNVLQDVITFVCSLSTDITALTASLAGYVKISDVDTYIAAYMASLSSSDKMYSKMIPYVAVEYYGPLSGYPSINDFFDGTGAGHGVWEKVFLCNGYAGHTPDKRGRLPIGTTEMGNNAFNPIVDPATPGNRAYHLYDTEGQNNVAISIPSLPPHTHTATVTIDDPGHHHTLIAHAENDNDSVYIVGGGTYSADDGEGDTTTEQTGLTGGSGGNVSVVNSLTGGGLTHTNVPPVLACHYIIYIP